MTSQAKTLKKILKKYDLTDQFGDLRIKTERIYRNVRGRKFYESGSANAMIRHLTEGEVELLKAESNHIKILNHYSQKIGYGYAIVSY